MTPTQFRAALTKLGWKQGKAAQELEISQRTVNGYANGVEIPRTVELSLAFYTFCGFYDAKPKKSRTKRVHHTSKGDTP